jgi:calcyclin binding protein
MDTEIEEARHLLSIATFSGIQKLLEKHILALEKATEQASTQAQVPPAPTSQSSNEAFVDSSHQVDVRKPVYGGMAFIPIEDFAWDQGGYNSPIVSIFIDLEGVGDVKDSVDFSCTATSFDLRVVGLAGKNYRLIKDNLDKDIVPNESKIVVKKNKIVIKLQKKKGEYSYDHWASLTSKKRRDPDAEVRRFHDDYLTN